MAVDVNLVGRQRQEQREQGIAPLRQEIAISRADRAGEQLVAHGASVHHEMKLEPVRPVQGRQACEAFERDVAPRGTQRKRILNKVEAEYAPHSDEAMIEKPGWARFETKHGALLARERKGDLGPREREPV